MAEADRRPVGFAPASDSDAQDTTHRIEHKDAPRTWRFEHTPELVFADESGEWAIDADELDYARIPPRSRAILRGLLHHALERLDGPR